MTATTLWRQVGWRAPGPVRRVDSAEIEFGPDWLLARGESLTPAYKLSWSLTTGSGWVTERLDVTIDGGTWSRRLELQRADGLWAAETRTRGLEPDRLGPDPLGSDPLGPDRPPGLVDDPWYLTEALDCDLATCPFTATMPILRHRLHTGDPAPRAELLVARVEVLSLAVVPSRQSYVPLQTDPPVVRHRLLDVLIDAPVRDLRLDEDGLVMDDRL